jgi:hypothetical protein
MTTTISIPSVEEIETALDACPQLANKVLDKETMKSLYDEIARRRTEVEAEHGPVAASAKASQAEIGDCLLYHPELLNVPAEEALENISAWVAEQRAAAIAAAELEEWTKKQLEIYGTLPWGFGWQK